MNTYPFLLRSTIFLAFLTLGLWGIYIGRDFFIPVSIAVLLAMLLLPVCIKLEKWGIHRIFSSFFAIIFAILIIAGIFLILYSQLISFAEDLPELGQAVIEKIEKAQNYITEKTGITIASQEKIARERYSNILQLSGTLIKLTLATTTDAIAKIVLLPIYVYFFLFYREKLGDFLKIVLHEMMNRQTEIIVDKIQKVAQAYLGGVFLVVLILAVLNTTGLMILGIQHAIFFGVLAAVLNIIPYVGVMLGSVFPILMAFITKDSLAYPLGVFAIFTFNQFLENNFITPNIVGSKVNINPLAAIMALVIGGMLWGIPGMILFIPFIGILKVVFDHLEPLKPYGFLLGEEGNEAYGLGVLFTKWKLKLRGLVGRK